MHWISSEAFSNSASISSVSSECGFQCRKTEKIQIDTAKLTQNQIRYFGRKNWILHSTVPILLLHRIFTYLFYWKMHYCYIASKTVLRCCKMGDNFLHHRASNCNRVISSNAKYAKYLYAKKNIRMSVAIISKNSTEYVIYDDLVFRLVSFNVKKNYEWMNEWVMKLSRKPLSSTIEK